MKTEVRVYRGHHGLTELRDPWRGLVDVMTDRSFVHAYEWHRSFLETQEPDPEATLFVTVSIDGSLEAILPLRPVRLLGSLGRRGLEVPLNPHVPFTDIVVKDPERLRAVMPSVLSSLARELGFQWDYIALRRTLGDSGAARCLRDVPGFPGLVSECGQVHVISLESYEALFSALSSRFRNNLRRAAKRAETLGDITYHTATSPQQCDALFAEFLQVEASGWKGKEGTESAIALHAELRQFYAALVSRFAVHGQCRIDVVRHADRPIAAAFHLVMDQTLYGLKIGYDESYAQIAPGNLLHWYIFRSACEDPRLATFNTTSGAAWHSQWRPRSVELLDIVVVRPGLAGTVANAEQRVLEHAADYRRRIARRWFVNERGRRRPTWKPPRRA